MTPWIISLSLSVGLIYAIARYMIAGNELRAAKNAYRQALASQREKTAAMRERKVS